MSHRLGPRVGAGTDLLPDQTGDVVLYGPVAVVPIARGVRRPVRDIGWYVRHRPLRPIRIRTDGGGGPLANQTAGAVLGYVARRALRPVRGARAAPCGGACHTTRPGGARRRRRLI